MTVKNEYKRGLLAMDNMYKEMKTQMESEPNLGLSWPLEKSKRDNGKENVRVLANLSVSATKLAKNVIAISFVFSLGYAVLRYHIAGTVPWKDFPFYVMNKAISLSSFVLLSLTFSLRPLQAIGLPITPIWLGVRKLLGTAGFCLMTLHALISFMIFNPATYGKFFESDGRLTLFAGLSMLGGTISSLIVASYSLSFFTILKDDRTFIQFTHSGKFVLTLLLLCGMHLFFMGYEGWVTPSKWQGGMPPISLLGFVLFAASFIINLRGRK